MARKTSSKKISGEALLLVAHRFKVLSEPMRLKLLMALQEGEKNVTTLVDETASTQANVSKHLALLADANMISRRKEGLSVFYFISDPVIFELCDLMCRRIEKEFASKSAHFR